MLTKEQIVIRMDELGDAARERMKGSPDNPNLVFAEIIWMTQDEVSEMLELRLLLPTSGQEREQAKARISQKIAKRKAKAVDSTP